MIKMVGIVIEMSLVSGASEAVMKAAALNAAKIAVSNI